MEVRKNKKTLQQSTLFINKINFLFPQILFFTCLISNISTIPIIEENKIIQSSSDGSDFFFLTKTEGILYYTPQSTSSSATYTFSSTPIKNLTPKIIKMSSDYFISCVSDAMFLLIDSSRNNLFKYGDSQDVSNIDFCFSQHYRYSTVLSYIIKSNKHLVYIYDYEINNMTIVNEEYTITESSTNLLNNFNKPDSCVLMKYILLCSYRLTTTNKIQFYILDLKQKIIKEVNMGFSETSTELKTTKFYTYSYKQNNFLLIKYDSDSAINVNKYNYDINTNTLSLDGNFPTITKHNVETYDSFDIIFLSKKMFLLTRNYEDEVEMIQFYYNTGKNYASFKQSQDCDYHYFLQISKISDSTIAIISTCSVKKASTIKYEIFYANFLKCVNKTFDSYDFSSDSNSFEINIENDEAYKVMNGYKFKFFSVPNGENDGIEVKGYYGRKNEIVTTSDSEKYKKFLFTKMSGFNDGQRIVEYAVYGNSSSIFSSVSYEQYSDVCYFIFNYYPCCEGCNICSAQCDKDNGHHYCSSCQEEDYYILEDDSSMCYKRDELLDYYYFNKEDENFQKCKKSCKTCKSYEDCLTCDDNYQESDFFHNDVDETKCVPYCETSGAWIQNVENKIIKCLDTQHDCKNLYNKYLLEDSFNNNECIPKCDYKNYTFIYNDERCTDSCLSIKKYYIPDELNLNNVTKEIRCLDECKDDYPFYGDNFQCLKKCENLYIQSNKTCTNSCLLYDLFLYKNEVCIDNCPFYYLADNKECVDSCIQYNKYYIPIPYNLTNDNPCLDSCSGLFPYYGDNNQCLQLCPYYYLQTDKKCVNSCITYKKHYIKIPQNITDDNPCMDSCPSDFPFYGDNYQCLKECPNYYLPNKTCVNSCNYYNENSLIKECITSCTSSEGYYLLDSNINKICYRSSCPTKYPFLTLPNMCSDSCGSQNFVDITTNNCKSSCDSLTSNSCKNICSFNLTYLIPNLGICVKQCDPILYNAIDDYFYCDHFDGLDNVTTKEEIIEALKDRIKLLHEYDSELDMSKFLISMQDTKETDKEKEEIYNSDYAYVDLGECENILKKENNIPDEEPLIILNIETKNDSKMCYDLNYTVYSLEGKKLDLSVCDGVYIDVNTPIRNPKGIDFEEAEEFSKINIDVFNRKDQFFNDLCYKYTSKDKTDVIIDDRVDNYYQNNTFCEDVGDCYYYKVDLEKKRVNCECETNTIVDDSDNNKQIGINNIQDMNVDSFIETIKHSTINVVLCYNLVFSLKFFTDPNYGGYIFIIIFIIQIILFIWFLVKKMKKISDVIDEIIFDKKQKETNSNQENNNDNYLKQNNNVNIFIHKSSNTNNIYTQDDKKDHINHHNNHHQINHTNHHRRTSKISRNNMMTLETEINNNHDDRKIHITNNNNHKPKIGDPPKKIIKEGKEKSLKDEIKAQQKFTKQTNKDKFQRCRTHTESGDSESENKKNENKNFNDKIIVIGHKRKIPLYIEEELVDNKKKTQNKNDVLNNSDHDHKKKSKKKGIFKHLSGKKSKSEDSYSVDIDQIKLKKKYKKNKKNKDKANMQRDTVVSEKEIMTTGNDKQSKNSKNLIKKKTTEEKTNVKKYLKYDKFLINYLEYEDALKYDKRSFWGIYEHVLLLSHNLIYTFFVNDKLNLKSVTISLFFFSITLNLAMNCLFYDDEAVSHTFDLKGEFDFLYNLPQTIYSMIISVGIGFLTQILTSVKNRLLFIIFELENKTQKEIQNIYNCIKIKIKIYFILVIILSAVFWYYIAAFCAVYSNSQKQFLTDFGISFAFELLTPFFFSLLITGLKKTALENESQCMYRIADFLF